MQPLHRVHVGDAALRASRPSPHSASTAPRNPFSRGVGAFASRASRVGPSRASTARGFLRVLLRLERMVVAERLAPVRHREVGLRLLRELELGDRLLPAEAVKNRDAAQEVLLRGRRAGCRKRQGPDVLELRGRGLDQRKGEDGASQATTHGDLRKGMTCP